MEKTRTWLIVSINESNDNALILNCVPMTTKLKKLPPHVRVTMDRCDCHIQCEHITTKNKAEFNDADYVGVLEESSMRRVEVALANQLGLSIQIPSLEVLQSFIEKLANKKAKMLEVQKSQVTDDVVLDLASKLEDIFDFDKSEVPVKVEQVEDKSSKEEVSLEKSVEKKEVKNAEVKVDRREYKKWDEKSAKEFLRDADKLSSREMSQKYGMTMKSIYSTKYRLRNTFRD